MLLTRQGISLSVVTSRSGWVSRFWFRSPLHVAMQLGLSLIPGPPGFRRTVSEDSQGLHLESFLLIVCTHRIVTQIAPRSVGYSDVPAYSRILLRLASLPNLRTVIVTAAVYWGFPSTLRLAADISG
jgi:hypothetical protein